MTKLIACIKHGKQKHFKRKDTKNSYRCSKCSQDGVENRRKKIKQMALEYMGGRCKLCLYSKCSSALSFHHLDPSKKDFSISEGGYTRSWERVKTELDKCILLCSNCHHEVHCGIQDIPS